MKKFHKVIKVFTVWCFLAFGTFSHAQELITNGSFEEWSEGLPIGWTKEIGVNITQETTPVYDGNCSVGLQQQDLLTLVYIKMSLLLQVSLIHLK